MSEEASRNISKSISEGVSGRGVAVGTTSSLYEQEDANIAAARPTSRWQTTARSTEDSTSARCSFAQGKSCEYELVNREQMFVIVDASCDSDPSSRELLVTEKKNVKAESSTGINKHVIPRDLPSTSHNIANDNFLPSPRVESDSREEMLLDINLQSENEINITDKSDLHSLIVSYLKNKEALSESDTLMSSKKKSSLLDSIHRLETIVEGQQFSTNKEISEEELDVLIPSYPGSERSLSRSISWLLSHKPLETNQRLVDGLHSDNELLIAAMMGNEIRMNQLIRENQDNVVDNHGMDFLGRTALHLAAVTGNVKCVELALRCGINPNIKDKLGMTALAMCLMQRPSLEIIKLLFKNGATITPRDCGTDVGLFLNIFKNNPILEYCSGFVMMCTPTAAEEAILRILIDNGASINDPYAPGERQALHFAAMSNNCDLIMVLVKLGANLYITNRRNETPFEVAVSFKCKAAADLLREMMSSATNIKIKCLDLELNLAVQQLDSPSKSSVKLDKKDTIISFD